MLPSPLAAVTLEISCPCLRRLLSLSCSLTDPAGLIRRLDLLEPVFLLILCCPPTIQLLSQPVCQAKRLASIKPISLIRIPVRTVLGNIRGSRDNIICQRVPVPDIIAKVFPCFRHGIFPIHIHSHYVTSCSVSVYATAGVTTHRVIANITICLVIMLLYPLSPTLGVRLRLNERTRCNCRPVPTTRRSRC